MIEIIETNAAWKGSDINDDPRWQYSLEDSELQEIDEALRHCKEQKISLRSIRADHFPLDAVKAKIAKIAAEVEES
jgi:hypothetical protein